MGKAIRILIVEDEFMISEDISIRLADFGYVIEGIADCAQAALEILAANTTDLALLDININGDIDGIQLAEKIRATYNIPIIFLTSFANKAVVERANKVNPSAYLLKPFNDRQVQIAIDMALQNFSAKKKFSDLLPENDLPIIDNSVIAFGDGLFLKKDTHFEKLSYKSIQYLEAESNYTVVYTDKSKFMYSCVLKNFESKLPSEFFKRVHRSFIVNINAITGFEGNTLHLGAKRIPVSKSYHDELFKCLNVF